jgi:4,4'-diaponeurosporenoate glycosyltransferase
VIVVDDCSDDDTGAIAGSRGVTVLDAGPLPPTWTGKSWACQQGADHADSDVLIFLDADVEVGPDALEFVAREAESSGGLVSVQPFHRVVRPYEWGSLFFNLVSVMGSGFASIRPPHRQKMAFGPVLAVAASDYRRIGGHRIVKAAVAEDVALAERFQQTGLPVQVFGGRDDISFRMYPDGLAQLIEGWSKNMATGAGCAPRVSAAGSALFVIAALLAGPMALASFVAAPAILPVVAWALFSIQVMVLSARVGSFPRFAALLHPIGSVIFVAVFVRSLVATRVRKRVTWRGRQISTNPSMAP